MSRSSDRGRITRPEETSSDSDSVEQPPEEADRTVSVVLPTYYRNDDLRNALESVFRQDYDPLEVIVVDGSEAAHATPVVEGDERVTYVPLEDDPGPQGAREIGVRHSSGRYVQFLDDDDRLLDRKLEKQVRLLRSNPEVGVVYCGLRWEDGPVVLPQAEVRGDVLEDALRFATSPAGTGTMLVDRPVLERVLPSGHRHGADDIGLKIELARITEFDFVDEVLLYRGDSPDSVGKSRAAVEGRKTVIRMYDDLYDRFPRARREALAETYLVSGELYLTERGWSLVAIREFARACYHVPGLPVAYVGSLLASLLGRRGYWFVRSRYSRRVLGDGRRGKST